ncbi:nucleotide exchange factor GrpE [Paracoccus marinus]|uniref:nucleotide exchange factor GrpE n=1 Tax=Paracoccus marinus TaxID=288426 RepID=UPI001040A1A4|nr:nucleotide exchange factor GrpE [Paracoccus marinus]GLS79524.1 protein GrpE [Paracoccus marinus]
MNDKPNGHIDLDAIEEGFAADAGPDPLATHPADDDRILAIEAERDDYRDRFMRALADAENARKRADKDRREAENYGGSRLARDLLPVHDALSRALAAATDRTDANAALIEGVELTLRELTNVFTKHGIKVIDPAIGERFDPQSHEAMFEAPVPGTRAGDIIQVMANGFMLHDRLLRAAQVGVSSTPASATAAPVQN